MNTLIAALVTFVACFIILPIVLAQSLVGECALSPRFGLVDLHEQVDEVDPGDDARGAAADAVEQVHPAVTAPDRWPVNTGP